MTQFSQSCFAKQHRTLKRQGGFGITECMIATFILMAGALAVSQATRLWHHKTGHLALVGHLHSLSSEVEAQLQPAFYSASPQQQVALFATPLSTGSTLATQLSGETAML